VNNNLYTFFTSVKNDEANLVFPKRYKDKSFHKLYKAFDEVNEVIRNIKIQNAYQNQYFQTVAEHVGVGLISFNEKGEIKLINKAFKDLFNIHAVTYLASLERIHEDLPELLQDIKPSERKLVKIMVPGSFKTSRQELLQLSLNAVELKFMENKIKLVSFQNIRSELEEKELESWQNIIRVLTHEIMNSTGPIISTTHTLIELITKENTDIPVSADDINNETIDDILEGMKIIEERSDGLEKFVKQFRRFTILPKLEVESFEIKSLFQSIYVLFDEQIRKQNILLSYSIEPEGITLDADKKLVEQIMINLVKNSIDTLKNLKNKTLKLKAFINREGRIIIQVVDNGPGIPPEDIEKIFIPFYTRKKTGSGIGLSLSKQIMLLHKGSISVHSEPGVDTVFTLRF
ncbi:MAG: hypothetical protein KAU83_04135, partial [Bacteroidales bacterium]|nr:hypothetical protein [Bacteroidales bacterium]